MADLIERSAVLHDLESLWDYSTVDGITASTVLAQVKTDVRNAPAVDAVPVVHGKWEWLSCTYDRIPKEKRYQCSCCHHETIVHGDDNPWEHYCPNCGADMRGEADGTD